jgi:amino acid adenylation domain-containing protein
MVAKNQRPTISDVYELSPMQEAMLFHSAYMPDSMAYFEQFSYLIEGELQAELFSEAWRSLANRHAVFRTSFHWQDLPKPVQVVQEQVSVPWFFADWRELAPDLQTRKWQQHLEEDRQRPFQLDRAPLLRCHLARLSDRLYSFAWSHHHIILDGWCLSIIVAELLEIYRALRSGRRANLRSARPYRDYIAWMQQQDQAEARDFWTAELKGFTAPTVLPMIAANHTERSTLSDRQEHRLLSGDLSQKLRLLAAHHQITANTLTQGAWSILLHRYSGQTDVIFGFTVSDRPSEIRGVEEMVGLFINTLPVRVQVAPESQLPVWLKRIQARQASRLQYAFASMVDIQQWSEVPKGVHLFDSNILFLNYPLSQEVVQGPGEFEIRDPRMFGQTDMPLTLQVTPGDQWSVEIIYDSNCFEADVIRRMIGHFDHLLEEFAADPDRPVAEFSILTEAERRQILEEFNDTRVEFDYERTVVHRLESVAELHADRVVVECDGRTLTAGAINRRSNQLARCLLGEVGLAADDMIVILMPRSEVMIESILAVWKCGAAYVPVEPDYPEDRIKHIVEDTGAKIVITREGHLSPSLRSGVERSARVVVLEDMEMVRASQDPSNLGIAIDPHSLAYVIFTSGSTGKPKGVMVEHVGMLNHILAKVHDLEIGPESVVAQSASHCFDISVWQMFAGPLVGGRTNIYSEQIVLEPDRFIDRVDADGLTILELVPSYLSAVLDRVENRDGVFLKLRFLQVTGEAVSHALIARWFKKFPGVPVANAYGPTECSDNITHYTMYELPAAPGIPIGRPLRNFNIYVLDEHMNICPVGIKGEICASGIGVGRGYLNDPERTAAAFMDDPFREGGGVRLYKTGDIGCYLPDGNILLFGRKDQQVKVRGYRIELGEVEAALARLAGIGEVAVVDRRDDGKDTYLCAYYTLKNGIEQSGEAIARELRRELPDYMIPAAFLEIKEMPLTPNGKVDRKALPAPDLTHRSVSTDYAAPRSEIEITLAGVWSEVLGVENPGIHDNFFSLGGDSILSMQAVSRAKQFGLKFGVIDVFQHPTIADLAAHAARVDPGQEESSPRSPRLSNQSPRAALTGESLDALLDGLRASGVADPKTEVSDLYELSPVQQGMLFHSLYTPESDTYFNQLNCVIQGSLNHEVFHEAWAQVIGHHPALRASFHWEGLENPVQVVHRNARAEWLDEDWSHFASETRDERWRQYLRDDRRKKFDLTRAPLMRFGIFRLDDQAHRFNWSHHHLLLDGWSSAIVLNDVLTAYEAISNGKRIELGIRRPFRKGIEWLARRDTTDARAYWRERMKGATVPTRLVLGKPEMEGSARSGDYAEQELTVGADLTTRLRALARERGITLNTIAQGAWGLLLWRYSGESDVIYGSVVSGRPAELEGADKMVGVFINTLPARIHVDPVRPLTDWLEELQIEQVEREQFAHSSLIDIQQWSEAPTGAPLFETILIFENYPMEEFLMQGAGMFSFAHVRTLEPTNYPITLVVTPGREIALKVVYDEGRFDRATIQRLLGHYEALMRHIAEFPRQALGTINIITEAERLQILEVWNQAASPMPDGMTFLHLFEDCVSSRPDHIAIKFGGKSCTYRELNDRANQLARYLSEVEQVKAGDRVAVLMPRSEKMVVSIFAIWKCGAAYVPIDPNDPLERIRTIVADSGSRVAISDSPPMKVNGSQANCEFRLVALDQVEPVRLLQPENDLGRGPSPSDLAYVIYTSGSTGKPKGAMIEHRGMLNHILAMVRELEIVAGSVVAQTASPCFDISVWQLLAALAAGGRTVIYPDEIVLDPNALARSLDADAVEVAQFVPSYLAVFLEELERAGDPPLLHSIRWLVLIGEVLKPDYARRWFDLYPGIKLMNAYGPTEASDSVTHYVMRQTPPTKSVPLGRPIQNMRVYVVDEQMNLCPVGIRGEICIGGVGVGRGYIGDEERTRAAFFTDPFCDEPGARLYKTGDIGCFASDGNLLFFGRKDHQIKLRGHRLELGEIESALSRNDDVRNAVVVDRETDDRRNLYAYVTLKQGVKTNQSELMLYLSSQLPAYMIPDVVCILPELPLTPGGKVDRKRLPALEAIGGDRVTYTPPVTETERQLVHIWEAVLGMDRVGIDDRFTEVGGHSLNAIQIVSRIRNQLCRAISFADIFESDAIRLLAARLEALSTVSDSQIPRIAESRYYETSHSQKRIWLASRSLQASVAYNILAAVWLEGSLDKPALRTAFQILIDRHESLRTLFITTQGQLRQRIRPAWQPEDVLDDIDLRDDPDCEATALDVALRQGGIPFDLGHGPLLKIKLIQVSNLKYVLALTVHHIVSDAWSLRVILDELLSLYAAGREGRVPPVSPPKIQYKDYAAWHNEWLKSPDAERERAFWLGRLSSNMPRTSIPADFPRSGPVTFAGDSVSSNIDEKQLEGLKRLAEMHKTSVYAVVLSAIYSLLFRYTNQEEIVVGTQTAGRAHLNLEDQVGCFVNTLVLRASIEGTDTISDVIGKIGGTLSEALQHQSYPFDLLLEDLKVQLSAEQSPLFDIQVDYVPNLTRSSRDAASDDLKIVDVVQQHRTTKYAISFLVGESSAGGGMVIEVVYSTGLFRRESITTLAARLQTVLRAFIEDETRRINAIELSGKLRQATRVQIDLNIAN